MTAPLISLVQFESNLTGMLPMCLTTKIAKIAPHQWTRWLPELKFLNDSFHISLGQFESKLTDMLPICLTNKIAKLVPYQWTRWPQELKIGKKSLKDSSSCITRPIWIKLDRHVAYVSLPKLLKWFCSNQQEGHQSYK